MVVAAITAVFVHPSAVAGLEMSCADVKDKYREPCCGLVKLPELMQSTMVTLVPEQDPYPIKAYNGSILDGAVFQDPFNGYYLRFEGDYLVEYTNKEPRLPFERWYIQPENGLVRNPPEMLGTFMLGDPSLEFNAPLPMSPENNATYTTQVPLLFSKVTQAAGYGYFVLSTWSLRMAFNEDYSAMRHDYYDVSAQNDLGVKFNTGFQFTSILSVVDSSTVNLPAPYTTP